MVAVHIWLSLAAEELFPLHFYNFKFVETSPVWLCPYLKSVNRLLHTFNIFEDKNKFSKICNTNKDSYQIFPSGDSESWWYWENTQRVFQVFLHQVHFQTTVKMMIGTFLFDHELKNYHICKIIWRLLGFNNSVQIPVTCTARWPNWSIAWGLCLKEHFLPAVDPLQSLLWCLPVFYENKSQCLFSICFLHLIAWLFLNHQII